MQGVILQVDAGTASGFDPSEYGRHFADVYDDVHRDLSPDAAAACIADHADRGAVLELGIGTGRLALPLVARGVPVDGIEDSPEIAEALRRKPGGDGIPVVVGDFATATTGRTYRVVVLAFNTIDVLPSQDAQVATFADAAAHLEPGGVFLVENWVPDPAAFHRNRAVRVHDIGQGQVLLAVAELHPAEQRMTTTRLAFTDGGVRLLPANHRYVWPGELDLMARLAGLRPGKRWQDWDRSPFTDDSTTYVAAYRKDP